jgi:hypothetical protein
MMDTVARLPCEISRNSLHKISLLLGMLISGFGNRLTMVTGLAAWGTLPRLNDLSQLSLK